MKAVAAERRRFGCRRIHIMLERQGIAMNLKKLRRLYREEKLQVRRRDGRKRALGTRPTRGRRSAAGSMTTTTTARPREHPAGRVRGQGMEMRAAQLQKSTRRFSRNPEESGAQVTSCAPSRMLSWLAASALRHVQLRHDLLNTTTGGVAQQLPEAASRWISLASVRSTPHFAAARSPSRAPPRRSGGRGIYPCGVGGRRGAAVRRCGPTRPKQAPPAGRPRRSRLR